MRFAQDQGSQSAVLHSGAVRDALPGWLRWFANLGLSLSAAECAIAPVEPLPASVRARSPALRRHV